MSLIDFREIPSANTGEGDQDTFEFFARDFFLTLGFTVNEGPGRGADGGKDLIVSEPLSGILFRAERRWLVSCKHYIHSGKAVGSSDEINIRDRLERYNCDGFLGFYSTIPSSGLNDVFIDLKQSMTVEVLDPARLEELLICDERLRSVAARYFPKSYRAKRRREIDAAFQKEKAILENEFATKKEEAARRRDAITLVWAEREHNRKIELAENLRNIELSMIGDEDEEHPPISSDESVKQ